MNLELTGSEWRAMIWALEVAYHCPRGECRTCDVRREIHDKIQALMMEVKA